MTAAALGRRSWSCRAFLATLGQSDEAAGNILHLTERSFVFRDLPFKFRDATSRSWAI